MHPGPWSGVSMGHYVTNITRYITIAVYSYTVVVVTDSTATIVTVHCNNLGNATSIVIVTFYCTSNPW